MANLTVGEPKIETENVPYMVTDESYQACSDGVEQSGEDNLIHTYLMHCTYIVIVNQEWVVKIVIVKNLWCCVLGHAHRNKVKVEYGLSLTQLLHFISCKSCPRKDKSHT